MDYEELYSQLKEVETGLKNNIKNIKKTEDNIAKNAESGDLKMLRKNAENLSQLLSASQTMLEEFREIAGSFDEKAYFESGDFARQLMQSCEEKGVDVKGDFPIYEMFPYRVRIDAENQDLYMNRKKVACMRPSGFAAMVKAGQEKLSKVKFNADSFEKELAFGYDMALLKMGKRPGTDIYLKNIYKMMVPMSRSKKEYDEQSFAYDLARLYSLYSEGHQETKDGRKFQFGPSRENGKAIRILDQYGKEQYLTTICFYE
ncbi:MAG: hypothetical protein J6D14_04930 [Lachnospiraceae bacterium]|nr:hypothetical protein [Lachnospiraceae bacterium]